MVYNMTTKERQVLDLSSTSDQLSSIQNALNNSGDGNQHTLKNRVPPKPIYLSSPPPTDAALALPKSRIYLRLVIDAAGKVQSAQLANKADRGPIGDTLIRASKKWNFIPGFRAGRPVATQILLGVSAEQ